MEFVDTLTGKWVFAILTAVGAAGVIFQIVKGLSHFLIKLWKQGPRRFLYSKKRQWIELAVNCDRFSESLLHWRLANSSNLIIHGFICVMSLQILLSFSKIGTLADLRELSKLAFVLILFYGLYEFIQGAIKYNYVLNVLHKHILRRGAVNRS